MIRTWLLGPDSKDCRKAASVNESILEQVLGVEIGGWNFGDWLPGSVSNDQQDAYTLVLSIVSTRDVTNNQTPACISQNLQYYQSRMNAYIAPADFVQVMNNAIQGNASWQSDRFIYLSGPGVYLREIERKACDSAFRHRFSRELTCASAERRRGLMLCPSNDFTFSMRRIK